MTINLSSTTDLKFRQTLFQNLYDTWAEDDAAIWIGQAVNLVTLRSSVQGYAYSFSVGGNYVPSTQIMVKP